MSSAHRPAGLGLAGRSQRGAKFDRDRTAATQRRDHAGRQCARLRFLVRRGPSGDVFSKPGTLRAFKRFQSESIQILLTIPPDTPAYAKGGEFSALPGSTLNAKSFAGQMIVNNSEGTVPVTFGFVVNWTGLQRLRRSPGRVLRSNPEHPDDHQAGSAMTGTVDNLS